MSRSKIINFPFNEDLENKIHNYIHGHMTNDEEDAFEDLMDENDNLYSHVMIHGMIIDSVSKEQNYKELEAACDSRDYLKIRSIVRKLIELDYDEREFPVKELIAPHMEHITGSEIEKKELDVLYKLINIFYEKNEWHQVFEIGKELDKLGAPEEVYQRKNLVEQSLKHLK